MDKDIIHKGECACGAVRFEAHGEPTRTVVCHCRYCQTRTHSAFVANVYFADEKAQFSGEMKTYVFTNSANRSFTNWFYPTYATTVAWAVELRPGWTGIAKGAFAPPTFWATPDAESFLVLAHRSLKQRSAIRTGHRVIMTPNMPSSAACSWTDRL